MFKRLVVWMGILLIAGCNSKPVKMYDEFSIEKASQATVMVYADGEFGASAVIIDSNCVMTAKHVAIHENLSIVTLDGDQHQVVKVVLDPEDDLAKLYIEDEFDEIPVKVLLSEIKVGETFIVVGTPYDPVLFPCILPGYIVKSYTECPFSPVVVITTANAGPGCSGCGVFDKEGNLRAIHIGSIGRLSIEVSVEEWSE